MCHIDTDQKELYSSWMTPANLKNKIYKKCKNTKLAHMNSWSDILHEQIRIIEWKKKKQTVCGRQLVTSSIKLGGDDTMPTKSKQRHARISKHSYLNVHYEMKWSFVNQDLLYQWHFLRNKRVVQNMPAITLTFI